jgi:hypothetical protein
VAEALLLDEGLSFSRHGSVIGEYGRLFARTERLDRRFHRLLNRTFAARQTAHYDTDFDLDRSEVHGNMCYYIDSIRWCIFPQPFPVSHLPRVSSPRARLRKPACDPSLS